MEVIQYDEKYRQDFIDFNTAWITENFGFLEKEDHEIFEKTDEYIRNGAMIFFAAENNTALACCMTMPTENDVWEICKLASNPNRSHKGAGSAVFEAAMKYAVGHGAKKIFLISNSKLKPALHIYEKYGFKEVRLDDYGFIRGDIAFEYII